MSCRQICDICGKEIENGSLMYLDAVYSWDKPDYPGHKLGWDVCLNCFPGLLPMPPILQKSLQSISKSLATRGMSVQEFDNMVKQIENDAHS